MSTTMWRTCISACSGRRKLTSAPVEPLVEEYQPEIAQLREAIGGQRVLEEMEALQPYTKFDDIFLLRYLITHKKDVDNAAKNVIQTLQYRKDNNEKLNKLVERGIDENDATVHKFLTVGFTGYCVGGWPVMCVRVGFSSLRNLMNNLSSEEVTEFLGMNSFMEYLYADILTRKTGHFTKNISIVDLNGVTVYGTDMRFLKCLGANSTANAVMYPQLLGKTIFLNAPSFMRAIRSTLALCMSRSAMDKVIVLSVQIREDREVTNEELAQCVYLSQNCTGVETLPRFLGGKADTPEHLIPVASRSDAMTKLNVSARSTEDVPVELSKEDSDYPLLIKLSVSVEDYGIGVQCKLVPSGQSPEMAKMMFPYRKIKSEQGIITADFEAEVSGRLILSFDNSYSYLRSKVVEYNFDLVPFVARGTSTPTSSLLKAANSSTAES